MARNYYIYHIPSRSNKPWDTQNTLEEELAKKELIGTQHFTGGKRCFTFVMPLTEFFNKYNQFYGTCDENDENLLLVYNFVSYVLGNVDRVIWEREIK